MADRYWIRATAGNWNDTANWSTSSGGGGGASVPGVADHAQFDANGVGNCSVDTTVSVAGLSFLSGYSGTFDANDNAITVGTSGFAMASGNTVTILGGAGTWTFDGGLVRYAGTFTKETSTWVLAGAEQYISVGSTTLHNLTVTGTYTGTNNFGPLTVAGTFDVQGTFNNNNQGISLSAGASLSVSGTLQGTQDISIQTGSVTSNTGTISVPLVFRINTGTHSLAAGTYGNVKVSAGGTGSATFRFGAGSFSIGDFTSSIWFGTPASLTIDAATNNPTLEFRGNVSLVSAVFVWSKGTGTLTLSGTSDQSIDFDGEFVEDLTIDKTVGTVTLAGDVTTDSITLTDGTLDIDGNTLTTVGNFTATAGTVVADTAATGSIVVGGNFALNGTSGAGITWTDANLDITGTAEASYTTVSGSDASAGTQVDATDNCTDGTGNLNWLFAVASTFKAFFGCPF